ncbi:MAG: acylphosphatase [Candidatus Marsarchaeota archaeon]|nr:acylphosphatase [Candidatus Marsarchaeota archaeon]MCL5102131.1 acylphosphatase [Candidatus Marsarchaeota archaeon]
MAAVKLVVHGIVQGVGYRALVRGIALNLGIKGYAKNMEDGTVEILAIGDESSINRFSEMVNVDTEHGPQVHKIERSQAEETSDYDSFYAK